MFAAELSCEQIFVGVRPIFLEMKKLFLTLNCIILLTTVARAQDLFPVTIIHFNDMHARFDETNMFSNTCKEGDSCIGGYARVVTKVKELLSTKASKNPLYLNAADNYQGTLWYNIYRWNVTSYFLNLLPADAMVRNFFLRYLCVFLHVNFLSDNWQSRV